MGFLDIDLDAFLSSLALSERQRRLGPDVFQPWTEARLRNFWSASAAFPEETRDRDRRLMPPRPPRRPV
jgi:hypothetical protein